MFPNGCSNINFTHVLKNSKRDFNLKFIIFPFPCFEEPVPFVRMIYIQMSLIQILNKIFYNNMFLLISMLNKVCKFILYYKLVILTL